MVTVRVGGRWGSGVMISPHGYVVTNGHVLRAANDKNVNTSEQAQIFVDDQWYRADVVTVSTGWMDLALLKAHGSNHRQELTVNPSVKPYRGQHVVAIGSGLFCPKPGCAQQSFTRGIICKVVKSRGTPVMLQSSALVHQVAPLSRSDANTLVVQGASGGALVDVATGDFLGLITSNARHISGEIIPQINFSIPASSLTSIVTFLEAAGRIEYLICV